MIKELIKKQIKKTGTYREVEIETQKLGKQIQTLDQVRQTQITALEKQLETSQNDKNKLNNQIETLQKDKNKLNNQIETLQKDKNKLNNQMQTLQKDKNKLNNQIETLQKDKNKLNNQMQTLQKDKQALKKERPRLLGYSMKSRPRGVSADVGKPVILKYILENIKKNQKVLDVGFGSGVYGKLLRTFYYRYVDGIDVFDKHLEEFGLDLIYDNIYIENILEFEFEFYDLIIMGDVLEHIELEAAKKLLTKFIEEKKCDHLIVSIPFESEQGDVHENVHEIHLQDNVTAKYMEKHYPYLDLIDLYYNSELGNIKAVYIWNKDLKTNPTSSC
jgi:2-polyprenyl-3-methyl-5-hydroxy-6-metoxy-1,4-benzoquinol methylase